MEWVTGTAFSRVPPPPLLVVRTDASNKQITTFFRITVEVVVEAYLALPVQILAQFDDGVR